MRGAAALAASLLLPAVLLGAAPAGAEPTRITVRVLAKGAKFVGTSMGGVRVLLRDADTGELLARGVTAGTTGDTARIMREPRAPGTALATPDAAAWTTTLDLEAPRRIEVEAFGPLGQPQAAHRVSSTQWVVPGGHVSDGDGWLLELPGFVVDVLDPPAHRKLTPDPEGVPVRANVTMMCGCPIEPGGLWDAEGYRVRALVRRDGEPVAEVPLAYAGETSQFAGRVPAEAPGAYEVTVTAWDPATGNTGLDRTTFVVAP